MREKTTINTKSIAITPIHINKKIANGEKLATESAATPGKKNLDKNNEKTLTNPEIKELNKFKNYFQSDNHLTNGTMAFGNKIENNRVFVNRSLHMEKIKFFGFD